MSDLSRPNHYFNDSLGDPATCTGDHNHPEPETDDPRFSGLPASVVENAKKAKCSRCKETVVESKAMTGTVMVNYYVPAVGVRQRTILCGLCGLLLRELLHPELADNPMYQAAKAELRARFM
jgi:hypothetical protein